MAKKNIAVDPNDPEAAARFVTTDADKVKANKWFHRARELGEKNQFEYAIEYYVNGMEFWPDAVEEACKPLHGCAVARKQTGGKKPGFKDTMKRSMTDKDPKAGLINALWLFGHDPDNMGYMEGIAKAASRLRAEDTAFWALGLLRRAIDNTAKVSAKQFGGFTALGEDLGARAAVRGETAFAIQAYELTIEIVQLWRHRHPKDQAIDTRLRDVSTKLTITRGKYKDGDSFRESLDDQDAQSDLHDRQRSVQSDDRVDQLIADAERTYNENTEDDDKLKTLVDLLTRRERQADEIRAIGFLVNKFKESGAYRWKQIADDIRMKQLKRAVREAAKSGDEDARRKAAVDELRFGLNVFKDRVQRYPTDNRIKFEYASRLFQSRNIDEAIPLLQACRVDPKNRAACGMYLGRCFYKKGFHDQAVGTLSETIAEREIHDDDLGKTLLYWLGRAQEENKGAAEARKTYGKLLQIDYNYRDVKERLEGLPSDG